MNAPADAVEVAVYALETAIVEVEREAGVRTSDTVCCFSLFIYPFIYLSVYLSIYLSMHSFDHSSRWKERWLLKLMRHQLEKMTVSGHEKSHT